MSAKKPSTAGYSGTPLAKKLGIRSDDRVIVLSAPENYEELLDPIPEGVIIASRLARKNRLIHLFVKRRSVLERQFPRLADRLERDGILWISWPKKSSGVATDVDESVVRSVGLSGGLVDVKICAVDQTWSDLKFVYRLEDR